MIFENEAGAIIDRNNRAMNFILGTPGSVEFPRDLIAEVHKKTPGHIFKLAHTHPPGMTELSQTDIKTLKGWAIHMHPYPIVMSTITELHFLGEPEFEENEYLAFMEPKSLMVEGVAREISIIKLMKGHIIDHEPEDWMEQLLDMSYKEENQE